MTVKRAPKSPGIRPVVVPIPGDRGTATMRAFTAREFIAMRKGTMSDVEIMEMTAGAVIRMPDGLDPLDLPPEDLLGLTANWLEAKKDEVVPPPSAER
jgi:hypothetical protein